MGSTPTLDKFTLVLQRTEAMRFCSDLLKSLLSKSPVLGSYCGKLHVWLWLANKGILTTTLCPIILPSCNKVLVSKACLVSRCLSLTRESKEPQPGVLMLPDTSNCAKSETSKCACTVLAQPPDCLKSTSLNSSAQITAECSLPPVRGLRTPMSKVRKDCKLGLPLILIFLPASKSLV